MNPLTTKVTQGAEAVVAGEASVLLKRVEDGLNRLVRLIAHQAATEFWAASQPRRLDGVGA